MKKKMILSAIGLSAMIGIFPLNVKAIGPGASELEENVSIRHGAASSACLVEENRMSLPSADAAVKELGRKSEILTTHIFNTEEYGKKEEVDGVSRLVVFPTKEFFQGLKAASLTSPWRQAFLSSFRKLNVVVRVDPTIFDAIEKATHLAKLGLHVIYRQAGPLPYVKYPQGHPSYRPPFPLYIEDINRLMNAGLQELDLYDQRLAEGMIHCMAEWIKENAHLERLNLSNIRADRKEWKAIGEALVVNRTLLELDLSESNVDDQGIRALGKGLKHNTVLQRLDLGGIDLGVGGSRVIAEGLGYNTALQQLGLCGNNIGDEGCIGIRNALKGNLTLKELDLGANEIGDEGATVIGEWLESNPVLQKLYLPANQIGDEGARNIEKGLRGNVALQDLSLILNMIGDEVREALRAVGIKDIRV